MLHENPLMIDINVDHWRNLQALILESTKEKPRIVVIHDDGEIVKFVHSDQAEIIRPVERITDASADAEMIYQANVENTELVMVLEREAVEQLFAEVQDSWRADEDLDVYVHRMYAKVDEYPDGIVTYPGPARSQLGLQWRLGASYEDVQAAVERFVPPNTTVVLGVFEGDTLWTTLVLGFDADKRITLITTADPTEIPTSGERQSVARELTDWVTDKYAACSVGLFMDIDMARRFMSAQDKVDALRDAAERGALVVGPMSESLDQALPFV